MIFLISACAPTLKYPNIQDGNRNGWRYLGWVIYGHSAAYFFDEISTQTSTTLNISGLPSGKYYFGAMPKDPQNCKNIKIAASIYDMTDAAGKMVFEDQGIISINPIYDHGTLYFNIKWDNVDSVRLNRSVAYKIKFSLHSGGDECLITPALSCQTYNQS